MPVHHYKQLLILSVNRRINHAGIIRIHDQLNWHVLNVFIGCSETMI